jgi:hypothetical protein
MREEMELGLSPKSQKLERSREKLFMLESKSTILFSCTSISF